METDLVNIKITIKHITLKSCENDVWKDQYSQEIDYYENLIYYNGATQITWAKTVFLLNGVGVTGQLFRKRYD